VEAFYAPRAKEGSRILQIKSFKSVDMICGHYRQADGARLEVQGEITHFAPEHYRLTHTDWAFDVENGQWYPRQSTLSAETDTRRLDLRLQTVATVPLRRDLLLSLGDFIVYEQTAYYEGQLWEKTAAGTEVLLAAFRGHGFKEYATKRWSR
jgi:hypothetical protein